MELYKIGFDPSSDTSTLLNNGGLFEYNKIKAELDNIDCNDFICILNGIGDIDLPKEKKKIFIATDSFCFDKNKDIMDKCDYILHQSEYNLEFISKPQTYSYVPFLFTTKNTKSTMQISKVIFGGANRGRDDKISKYIVRNGIFNEEVVPFLKIYNDSGDVVFDNRINYDDFIKVMRSYKYTICFSRQEYDDLKWTTPRYIEAISNNVLPIIDSTYCTHSSFFGLTDIVYSRHEIHNILNYTTEEERIKKLIKLNSVVLEYKDAFKDTILKIIG